MHTHAPAHRGRNPMTASPTSTVLTSGLTQRRRARCQLGLQSPEGLGLADALLWWFWAEDLSPQGCLSVLTTWWLASSKTNEGVRGHLGGSHLFYELALEITRHHRYYTLFIRGELLSLAYIQGKEN